MHSQNSRVFKGFQDAYEPCRWLRLLTKGIPNLPCRQGALYKQLRCQVIQRSRSLSESCNAEISKKNLLRWYELKQIQIRVRGKRQTGNDILLPAQRTWKSLTLAYFRASNTITLCGDGYCSTAADHVVHDLPKKHSTDYLWFWKWIKELLVVTLGFLLPLCRVTKRQPSVKIQHFLSLLETSSNLDLLSQGQKLNNSDTSDDDNNNDDDDERVSSLLAYW